MKKLLIYISLFFICADSIAQKYVFDSIPAILKKNARAVIRSEQSLYRIFKPDEMEQTYKMAVTLINENTKDFRLLQIPYDKFSGISSFKGAVYDENGSLIKTYNMIDLYDMSAISGASFYTDDRMKIINFPVFKYPYTIEYEYKKSYSSLINYADWDFQKSTLASVEKSGIQFVLPKDMKLRYLEKNLKNKVDSVINGDNKIYTWQEENLPVTYSPYNYAVVEYPIRRLYAAPIEFEYGGYKGTMHSWKSFGNWFFQLNSGIDNLPEQEIKKINELTSGINDTYEKIRIIYQYMQSKTRYVSIHVGIGGFKSAPASAVSLSGFGDCKALVTYTKALLKVAGIESFYTLVLAGTKEKVNREFVSNYFNHVILCVPVSKDTVWLECTNQSCPFKYLSDFTADKDVLVIVPDGSKIVKTPGFSKEQNVIKRSGSFYLNIVGASSGKMSEECSGIYYGKVSDLLGNSSEEELKEYLASSLEFPDLYISSAGLEFNKAGSPKTNLTYSLEISNFAVPTGKRLIFSPDISPEQYFQDIPVDFEISEPKIKSDSIVYSLPLGYRVDYMPPDVKIENKFGRFSSRLYIIKDKIIFERYFILTKGNFPESEFNNFRDFINTIANADRAKVILSKGI